MTVKPTFAFQLYKDEGLISWLNYYATEKNDFKGDCESQSLTLCWYLLPLDLKCFAAQISSVHTVVYLPSSYYIDINIGCVFSKDFSKMIKLSTFSKKCFHKLWGKNGLINLNDPFNYIAVVPVEF